jgi:hypothetical protein
MKLSMNRSSTAMVSTPRSRGSSMNRKTANRLAPSIVAAR